MNGVKYCFKAKVQMQGTEVQAACWENETPTKWRKRSNKGSAFILKQFRRKKCDLTISILHHRQSRMTKSTLETLEKGVEYVQS